MAEALGQESREGLLRHLARAHDELAMLDPAAAHDVAIDGDVVGRIGEDHVGLSSTHQTLDVIPAAGTATQDPVQAELPEVAELRDRCFRLTELVLARGEALLFEIPRQQIELGDLETGDGEIQPDPGQVDGEFAEFEGKGRPIPAGQGRDLVVGDRIGRASACRSGDRAGRSGPCEGRAAWPPTTVRARRARARFRRRRAAR